MEEGALAHSINASTIQQLALVEEPADTRIQHTIAKGL
jgi:hypothetical protein